jgi:hypothetical protein
LLKAFLVAFILILVGCAGSVSEPVNLILLIDCSSSVSAERGPLKKHIIETGKWWAGQAMSRDGGKFEVLIIGNGIDDVRLLFSKQLPTSWEIPIYQSKKKWASGFERELDSLADYLPSDQGSAIFEAVFRASERLSELSGEKILIINSDLRQVNKDFNFERSVPESLSVIEHWLIKQDLNPELSGVRVSVTGFLPCPPSPNTSRISPADYGRLRRLWISLFEEWGVNAKLHESLNLKDLEGGVNNESENQ